MFFFEGQYLDGLCFILTVFHFGGLVLPFWPLGDRSV